MWQRWQKQQLLLQWGHQQQRWQRRKEVLVPTAVKTVITAEANSSSSSGCSGSGSGSGSDSDSGSGTNSRSRSSHSHSRQMSSGARCSSTVGYG